MVILGGVSQTCKYVCSGLHFDGFCENICVNISVLAAIWDLKFGMYAERVSSIMCTCVCVLVSVCLIFISD